MQLKVVMERKGVVRRRLVSIPVFSHECTFILKADINSWRGCALGAILANQTFSKASEE